MQSWQKTAEVKWKMVLCCFCNYVCEYRSAFVTRYELKGGIRYSSRSAKKGTSLEYKYVNAAITQKLPLRIESNFPLNGFEFYLWLSTHFSICNNFILTSPIRFVPQPLFISQSLSFSDFPISSFFGPRIYRHPRY